MHLRATMHSYAGQFYDKKLSTMDASIWFLRKR
jgi:hypothetical protein